MRAGLELTGFALVLSNFKQLYVNILWIIVTYGADNG